MKKFARITKTTLHVEDDVHIDIKDRCTSLECTAVSTNHVIREI